MHCVMDGNPAYSHSAFNVGFGWGEICDTDKVDIKEYADFIHTYIYIICMYKYVCIYLYVTIINVKWGHEF